MGDRARSIRMTVLAAALIVAPGLTPFTANRLAAQSRVGFEAKGGIGVPVGNLNDLTDVGPSVGAGIVYWISPRLAVRADFDANLLDGKESSGPGPEGPDIDLFHFGGGLQLGLTDAYASPWRITVNVGAGATRFESDPIDTGGPVIAPVEETYFALNGGLGIGYGVSRNVDIFVDGQWYLTLTDDEDTAVFATINPRVPDDGFDTVSVVPLSVGIRIHTR